MKMIAFNQDDDNDDNNEKTPPLPICFESVEEIMNVMKPFCLPKTSASCFFKGMIENKLKKVGKLSAK